MHNHYHQNKFWKSIKFSIFWKNKGRILCGIILLFSIHYIWKLYDDIDIDKVSSFDVVELQSQFLINNVGHNDWRDEWYCELQCLWGRPCEYKDEVDFRIIVITYNRAHSLRKCLESIQNLETLGDKISVDIWIDRSKGGVIDSSVEKVSRSFQQRWVYTTLKGRACVHLQEKNAFINRQWVDTWRPKRNTKELALILEDDVSISPWSYKWIKNTHLYFEGDERIAGYSLQMEDLSFFAPNIRSPIYANPNHTIFLYPLIGTWGYAPHPVTWRKYQDWLYSARPDFDIKTDLITPHVPGIMPNYWYKNELRMHTQEAMHEMWHIKFAHDFKLFTVYSNLLTVTGRKDVVLSTNRKEEGLHFGGGQVVDNSACLLHEWNDLYIKHPPKSDLILYNYDGSLCTSSCCCSTTCDSIPYIFFRDIFWQVFFQVMKPLRKIGSLLESRC